MKYINYQKILICSIFVLFIYTGLITAWLSDDALLTLKQVLNTINYHEISLTLGERIQAFNHPTWFIVLLPLIQSTNEIFITTILLSLGLAWCSIIYLYLYVRDLKDSSIAIGILFGFSLLLCFSKAFTDYMTSGLENALSYYLIGFIIYTSYQLLNQYKTSTAVFLYIIFALSILNRLDYICLLSPLAMYLFFRYMGIKKWPVLIPGIVLIMGWFSFAIIYFGLIVANPIFAKFTAGISFKSYIEMGINYYFITFSNDPVTMLLVILGVIAGFINRNANYVLNRCLSFGMINYCLFILISGGDAMIGKYFAILAYIAIFNIIAAMASYQYKKYYLMMLVSLFFIAPFSAQPLLSSTAYRNYFINKNLRDERGWFYQSYGLLAKHRNFWPQLPELNLNQSNQPINTNSNYIISCDNLGIASLMYPKKNFIDNCGTTDRFLAQLVAIQAIDLRSASARKIPTNYGEYLIKKVNKIDDVQLQPLLDDLNLINQPKLFTMARFKAIYRLNISRSYQYNYKQYSDPGLILPVSTFPQPPIVFYYDYNINQQKLLNGTLWNITKVTAFTDFIHIEVPNITAKSMQFSLDCNDEYSVIVNNAMVYNVKNSCFKVENGGLINHIIKFDEPIVVNSVIVKALAGDKSYSLGHLIFLK